jgi:PhnB protein
MPAIPYLFFNGNCREAMTFYQEKLGGSLDLLTFKDAPEGQCPAGTEDRVMHARLVLPDGGVLMASDDVSEHPATTMTGFAVSVSYASIDDAKRAWDALSDGATQIWMPFTSTFWSDGFGMLADRFGVGWMVSQFREDKA